MSKYLYLFVILLLIISASMEPTFALETSKIYESIDNEVYKMVEPGKANGAVLSIVQDDEIQLCKGYGFADEYNNILADGEKTAFRIGSVSKTFVAVAAQILHQEGKLDMNIDISNYLESDFPKLKYPVTMHHLLTHTAGFEEIATGIAVFNISDTEPLSKSVRKYMPDQIFKPGKIVSYSNYGIALAAYVIESIAAQDFAQYCHERIFVPLDMNRTTFEHMHDLVYVSKPYLPSGEEALEPYMNLYPEGSAVSTAEDMAKYMKWLLNEHDTRVLSLKSKKELFSKQFSMSEELEGIGYIWNRKTRNNTVYYEKKGETLHFYTRIVLYPEEKTGIFLSFNTFLPKHQINAVIEKATDLLYGKQVQPSFGADKATIDISGLYVNNWSSYKTPEKILRYLIPGKMLTISRTKDNNFSINGENLTLVGDNIYSSPIGLLKFQEKEGKIIIATESAITFSKVPFWQHSIIQMLILLLFFTLSLTCFLMELVLLVRKRSKIYKKVFLVISLIQLLLFSILCLLMYNGIVSYSLLAFDLPMKICGWLILAVSVVGIAYTFYVKLKYELIRLPWIGLNVVSILFCMWMYWLNIL